MQCVVSYVTTYAHPLPFPFPNTHKKIYSNFFFKSNCGSGIFFCIGSGVITSFYDDLGGEKERKKETLVPIHSKRKGELESCSLAASLLLLLPCLLLLQEQKKQSRISFSAAAFFEVAEKNLIHSFYLLTSEKMGVGGGSRGEWLNKAPPPPSKAQKIGDISEEKKSKQAAPPPKKSLIGLTRGRVFIYLFFFLVGKGVCSHDQIPFSSLHPIVFHSLSLKIGRYSQVRRKSCAKAKIVSANQRSPPPPSEDQ